MILLLQLVVAREVLAKGESKEWGYAATFSKNITHQRCYEGIGPEMLLPSQPSPPKNTWKAKDCPAYSINCVKVTMCKIINYGKD